MFLKQLQVFNSRARILLVSGPRISGKTRGVLNRVVRHLWETKTPRIGMFVKTLKSSKDGGAWTLLNQQILPEWFESGIGMRYTTSVSGKPGPKTDGLTRTPFFRVSNCHGGESEMMLFSIDNDSEIEAKLKELEFSMVYFSELDKFGDPKVLTVALPSLRMGHLRYEDQMWIADCNPSEEGEASWIYKYFFKVRNMAYFEYQAYQRDQGLPLLPEEEFRAFYNKMDVIEILPRDNSFVDPRQLQEVKVSCANDEGLYARHVDGKWVWGGGDSSRHFRVAFKAFRHVIGDASDDDPENWVCLNPTANCFELITGWDLGDVNHAAVILEKTYTAEKPCFSVLDECVSIKTEMGNVEFTEHFMDLIEALEKYAVKTFELNNSWSDRNSLEKYSAAGDTYPYLEVQAASNNRIRLRGVGREAKAKGSVRQRVYLLKQLLAEDRIKVSAHCKKTIAMFQDLKKGGSASTDFVVQNEDKHVFDALSYAIFMECHEYLEAGGPSEGKRPVLMTQV